MALSFAIFVNASILVLAAATFHGQGLSEAIGIEEAYRLLAPTLGAGAASTLFAVALLASGQNSAVTGTLAGQIVMEGFTDLRWPPWLRRLVARLLAMVPAMIAIVLYGDDGATALLVFSQVVLSLQLPFAVYPLVRLTNSRTVMGPLVNRRSTALLAWIATVVLAGLNGILLLQALVG